MKTVTLPSGAELRIDLAPFADAKALYQAILEEGVKIKITSVEHAENVIKDLFCTVLSSKRIEESLYKCFQKSLYGGVRIANVNEVFESLEARGDYFQVCIEVARENIMPFMKDLYAQYGPVLENLKKLSRA